MNSCMSMLEDDINLWKKPLQKKKQRKLRMTPIRQERKKNIPKPEEEKLVVHNAVVGIQYPAKPNEQFAIIKVDNFQYKVLEDTLLVLDRKRTHEINQQIIFDQILLYGTKTYTCVGRPYVTGTKVTAIIESMSDSQKIIVFKKKRRKQYKKSYGSRIPLTMCRITKIQHTIPFTALQKAIGLQ